MATGLRTIKLKSGDGDIFDVDVVLTEQSELLKNFAESKKDKTDNDKLYFYFNQVVEIMLFH